MNPLPIVLCPHHFFFFAIRAQLDPGIIPTVNAEGIVNLPLESVSRNCV